MTLTQGGKSRRCLIRVREREFLEIPLDHFEYDLEFKTVPYHLCSTNPRTLSLPVSSVRLAVYMKCHWSVLGPLLSDVLCIMAGVYVLNLFLLIANIFMKRLNWDFALGKLLKSVT